MSKDLRAVIVGGHHIGYHTARHLKERGHEVVIVEKDSERVEYLSEQYTATVIHGDGSRQDVLKQAGLEQSDVIAALTGYGAMTNIGICLMANNLEEGINTVARIDHGNRAEYTGMVDRVVYPEQLAAHAATNEIMRAAGRDVQTLEQISEDLELVEIRVAGGAPVAGHRLEEVSFPRGTVIISARESDSLPGPEMELTAGNRYVVAVHTDVSDEVVRLFRG